MTWCLLRNEVESLTVNVVDLGFDTDRPSPTRGRGWLTVEATAADVQHALDSIVHRRDAVVLERVGAPAIEMRLTLGSRRSQSLDPAATTYEWAAP